MPGKKEKRPLPSKLVRVLYLEDRAKKAALENRRNRAMASYYFDLAPAILNIAKGVYYWTKGNLFPASEDPEDYKYNQGAAPAVGALPMRAVGAAAKYVPWDKVLQGVARGTAALGLLGNGMRSLATDTEPVEEASSETSTVTTESPTESTLPEDKKPDDKKKDDEKPPLPKKKSYKDTYKEEMRKVGSNIGNFYKNIGTTVSKGIGYSIGYGTLPATGYGIYKLATDEPDTYLDSISNIQAKQKMELEQMLKILENLKAIEEMKKKLLRPTETDSTDVNGNWKPKPASRPVYDQAYRDSISRAYQQRLRNLK